MGFRNLLNFYLVSGNGVIVATIGNFTHRVFVTRTRRNDSFVTENYSPLHTEKCPITRMCKFANDRGTDVFEVILPGVQV